jgi:hypothetical protein
MRTERNGQDRRSNERATSPKAINGSIILRPGERPAHKFTS